MSQDSLPPEEHNPLEFWVAYIPAEGGKKNYLSDGKGHIRVFKSEPVIREYLSANLRPEVLERVVVHPVQGQIAIPDDGTLPANQTVLTPQHFPHILPNLPIDLSQIASISTLAPPTLPTAMELLDNYKKRRRKK